MTKAGFRRIALTMPEASESAHMDHPDFRVRGKIFATLFTRGGVEFGTVKLTPEQQRQFISEQPMAFELAAGAWGRRGYTLIRLRSVNAKSLREAMFAAWANTAPKRLIEKYATPGAG